MGRDLIIKQPRFIIRACPRCGGDLLEVHETYPKEVLYQCLQCSRRFKRDESGGLVLEGNSTG